MPTQKPFRSKQDYATPDDFIAAVKQHLGIAEFAFDFAASAENAKAPRFWTKADDSLSKTPVQWGQQILGAWGWLNPPFTAIGPWAKRCAQTAALGGQIAFLVPAAVGSNWYRDYVDGKARVLALNGRLSFMGGQPYPKDLILALYAPFAGGFEVWNWRASLKASKVA